MTDTLLALGIPAPTAGVAPADAPSCWYCAGDPDAPEPEPHPTTSRTCPEHRPEHLRHVAPVPAQVRPVIVRYPCAACHELAPLADLTVLRSSGQAVSFVHRSPRGCP